MARAEHITDLLHPALVAGGLFEKVAAFCAEGRVLFADKAFPPPKEGLGGAALGGTAFALVQWRRAGEVYGAEGFTVAERVSADSLLQGSLGNAHFLSALAVLADYPPLLRRLFCAAAPSPHGLYGVWLNARGHWEEVLVDDYFPFVARGGAPQPVLCHCARGDLWPMLLEKAWAKASGGYLPAAQGSVLRVIEGLAGVRPLPLQPREGDAGWRLLLEAARAHDAVVCCAGGEGFGGCAYVVEDALERRAAGGEVLRLLRLRNALVDGAFRSRAQHDEALAPLFVAGKLRRGEFWLLFDEFARLFDQLARAKLLSCACFNSLRVGAAQGRACVLKIVSGGRGWAQLSLQRAEGERGRFARATLAQLRDKRLFELVGAQFSAATRLHFDFAAQKGEYALLVEGCDGFALSSCSEHPLGLLRCAADFGQLEQRVWEDFCAANLAALERVGELSLRARRQSFGFSTLKRLDAAAGLFLVAKANASATHFVHERYRLLACEGLALDAAALDGDAFELFVNPGRVGVLLLKLRPTRGAFLLRYEVVQRTVGEGEAQADALALEAFSHYGAGEGAGGAETPRFVSPAALGRADGPALRRHSEAQAALRAQRLSLAQLKQQRSSLFLARGA